MPKSLYRQAEHGEVKYLILEAREKYYDKRAYKHHWLNKFIIHNSNFVECELVENGVTAKVTYYDKTMGTITFYITDQNGVSKPVQFYGDYLAFSKCITYMRELSSALSWDAYQLELKNQELKRLKKKLQELKEENRHLKRELDKFIVSSSDVNKP